MWRPPPSPTFRIDNFSFLNTFGSLSFLTVFFSFVGTTYPILLELNFTDFFTQFVGGTKKFKEPESQPNSQVISTHF